LLVDRDELVRVLITGTDPEPALRDAFTMFDTEGKGKLHEE